MSKENSYAFILNPVSSGGKSLKFWKSFEPELNRHNINFIYKQTLKSGDATVLAQDAINEGHRKIIAVGGDGTLHQVANGILLQKEIDSKEISMGLIPMGTGNDFARYWKLPNRKEQIIQLLKKNNEVLQDAIKVSFLNENKTAYIISMGGCGFDSHVAVKAHNEKLKGNGGKLVYLRCLATSLFSYKAQKVSVTVDGNVLNGKIFSVAIGNNHSNGGGIKQCPEASMTDGKLNITVIGDISIPQIILNLKGLFSGSFTKHKKVKTFSGANAIIKCEGENILELDGEPYFNLPAEIEIVPSCLKVMVPVC
ncbi:lipid kinase [Bacteroidota bacterium]|nr:lipid kinase [Bacteroidota bacterium]